MGVTTYFLLIAKISNNKSVMKINSIFIGTIPFRVPTKPVTTGCRSAIGDAYTQRRET